MSNSIVGFVKRLIPTLSKSDLETDLEVSMDALKVAISSFEDFKSAHAAAKINSPEVLALVKDFYKEYDKASTGISLSGGKRIAEDLLALFHNLEINGALLQREIADISNEVIISSALSAARGNVLRGVEHFYFITRYALDLINHLYCLECKSAGLELSKAAIPNPKQVEFIDKNLWVFARLLAVYGQEPKDFSRKLESLTLSALPKEKIDELMDIYKASQVDLFSNLPDNFIGSPIYTVRLIFSQWEADRYKQLKDKKKLLELRALHLRLLREQGHGDVNTEKEIEYLQKRITDIDHSISRTERSAGV